MNCYLKNCTKCSGDLVLDDGYWRCLQCGRYYYATGSNTGEAQSTEQCPEVKLHGPVQVARNGEENAGDVTRRQRPKRVGGKSMRNINSVIRANKTSDDKWWARNRQVIECLDKGLSAREVSGLVGVGQRQIRVVRERLIDLRAEAAASED